MKSLKLLTIFLAGLWLGACTHTGSPVAPRPEKEETNKSTSESRATLPDTTESKSQETREKTPNSPAASQAATSPDQKETAENTKISRTAFPDATKPKSEETDRANSAAAAGSKLEEARNDLRLSRETEKRIASEIEQLNKTGEASDEVIKDYEIYHERVQAMVDENRKIVEKMEAAYARHSSARSGSNVAPLSNRDKMFDPNIPEEQTVDEVAVLDRQLNESLAQFDDRLLKEMDAIRAGSAKKMQDLAQEAAEAAKRLREEGIKSDTSGTKSSGEAEERSVQKDKSESGREVEPTEGAADTATVSRDESRKGGEGPSRKKQRRTEYKDDDIVARQLREAAENETNPELKKKLWKEYEEYKKSGR